MILAKNLEYFIAFLYVFLFIQYHNYTPKIQIYKD